ncbi:hypothetical protein EST38_g13503 [Candolleomyces aberdarensis]|uniref:Uncharacterized protein n=1 Tax=Candolleomyces aberdarensis TaxID=2316362 RepID=A0A4Q2D219_9AGAR|nr:hypothetical protein EST38_g13503 [Candolleomyces aberdarensis]
MSPVDETQAQAQRTETPPPTANEINDNIISDPPPPYPTPRTRRTRRSPRHNRQLHSIHTQIPSVDSYSEQENPLSVGSGAGEHTSSSGPNTDDSEEQGPFLSPTTTTGGLLRNPNNHPHRRLGRPRSLSHASTLSAAPSLGQTVLSLFEQDADHEDGELGAIHLPEDDGLDERHIESMMEDHDGMSLDFSRRNGSDRGGWTSLAGWRRYFRPMGRAVYYRSLVHLLFINFPYALAAWVYLFVFTVTGTTLLVALPLGALLCFLNLLGARAFSRGELALQTTFHSPLSYPAPYPPRPIFTRYREPTTAEIESGRLASGRSSLVPEPSFYKNAYSMFTDPTSYQALFYFIVIKPAITLSLLLVILIFAIPAIILIIPAPAALRAVRRLGKWQANIAVEGLYHAVR